MPEWLSGAELLDLRAYFPHCADGLGWFVERGLVGSEQDARTNSAASVPANVVAIEHDVDVVLDYA